MRFIVLLMVFSLLTSFLIEAAEQPAPRQLIAQFLPTDPVIVEAGAQFGEDTSWMSKLWPQGKIYAFEPNPASYKHLLEVATKTTNIFPQPLALAKVKGVAAFYVAGGASSLLKPTDSFNNAYFKADLKNPIMVQTITLEQWARENNVQVIDFLWLDMEGNELNALEGAGPILDTVKAIYTEVNLQQFWHGAVQHKQLEAWLIERGFEKKWEDIVPNWHGNVLFVRKSK